MGVRGEIFSTTVALQNRTYFFNVKENRLGDLYLNIVESKNRESGGFERQSVILFSADLREFLAGFDESLRVLEKAERERRKGARPPRPPRPFDGEPASDSGEGFGNAEGGRYRPREERGDNDGARFRPREARGPRDSEDGRFKPRRAAGDSRETRRPRGDRPEGGNRASFGKRERPAGNYKPGRDNTRPGPRAGGRPGFRDDRPRPGSRPGFRDDRPRDEKPRRRVVRRKDNDE